MTMGTRIAVMDKGELQQVGTPQELYDNPKKLFVAGFIGSPSMNFMDLSLSGDTLTGPGFTTPLAARFKGADAAASLIGGFRPEHFELGDVPNSISIRAKADVVEFLGDEELLHLTVAGHEGDIVAVVGSENRVKPGDVLDLKLPFDKLHLFDKATGNAVAKSSMAAATA
jgi:multiple sugar transport system ATP-binding protein